MVAKFRSGSAVSRHRSRFAFSLFLLCVVASFLLQTFSLNSLAQFVPLFVVFPTFSLLLAQVSLDLRGGETRGEQTLFDSSDRYRKKTILASEPPKSGVGVAWLVFMLGLVYLLGFLAASPLYTFLYLRFRGRKTWQLSAAFGVGVGILSYALFQFLSNSSPYIGKVWSWVPSLTR
jgi:tripartite tricarboxylate transporter TctB family protein